MAHHLNYIGLTLPILFSTLLSRWQKKLTMPKRRECLPSKEREAYVRSIRASCTEVTARVKNRYVDEFLRFSSEQFGNTNCKKITREQLEAYAAEVSEAVLSAKTYNPSQKQQAPIMLQTARLKVATVIEWLDWLTKNGMLSQNPGDGLSATELVK